MSFYSRWQPLLDEDQHTALVFGFFRHAPVSIALEPWLCLVLGRSVTAEPLQPRSSWPLLPSIIEGSTATEPELVFDANDASGPLKVVVEVKPGIGMQTVEQLSREIIDVATVTGATRVVLVAVDADLGASASTSDWQRQVIDRVHTHGLAVDVWIHPSPFSLIGEVIAAAGKQNPDWKPYADDVTAQLKRKGLLNYQGAPMLDDLETLTLGDAVEAFNRITAAVRQFYLQLHQHGAFVANRLQPDSGQGDSSSPRMLRDGRTDKLHRPQNSFTSKVILSVYRHPDLQASSRLFVAFDLIARTRSEIDMLAGRWDYQSDNLNANATTFATALSRETALAAAHPQFPFQMWAGLSRWTYDRRTWQPGSPDEDIDWAISHMAAAVALTSPLPAGATPPSATHETA